MFIQTPSNRAWIAVAMLDLPARGGPFSSTIWPGAGSGIGREPQ